MPDLWVSTRDAQHGATLFQTDSKSILTFGPATSGLFSFATAMNCWWPIEQRER